MSELQAWLVCQSLAPEKSQIEGLGRAAAREHVEYGAPITRDWKLGKTARGKPGSVTIQRPTGAKGTLHTHILETMPSPADLWDALAHRDLATCISEAKIANPETRCYYPRSWEEFQALGMVVETIEGRKEDWLQGLRKRYGQPQARTEMERLEGLNLVKQVRGLEETIKKAESKVFAWCQV